VYKISHEVAQLLILERIWKNQSHFLRQHKNNTTSDIPMPLKLKKSALNKSKEPSKFKKRHTVMVVDDEPENLRALISTLEDDYKLITATDGLEALELVKAMDDPSIIHLIISDQRMPRMTGVEFLEETISIIPKTIRMILTGFSDVDAIISSINQGQVYKFMTKPIDTKDLSITVGLALERFELEENIQKLEQQLIRCPLTKLYNENYFLEFLKIEAKKSLENRQHGALLLIELDHISDINLNFGIKVLDDTTRGLAYVFEQLKGTQHLLFKLKGPSFACYIPLCDKKKALEISECCRIGIEKSENFVQKITVCVGLVNIEEFWDKKSELDLESEILNLAQQRLKLAKKSRNQVCYESSISKTSVGKILIIDNDSFSNSILKEQLETENYEVLICTDGAEGIEMIERESPDIIIAELILPKIDGFLVREKIMESSDLKNKVFILLSHLKSEESIRRAVSLNIEHYFKKPYFPIELLGLIKNKLK
jgi:diguanylate cyclase (GGDEF)-like protein